MARKPKHPEHVNHERWLVSYADFITLLFAFFTVLYATAQTDQGKINKLVGAVERAFTAGVLPGGSNQLIHLGEQGSAGDGVFNLGLNLRQVEQELISAVEKGSKDGGSGLGGGAGEIRVERHAEGLTIVLQTRHFFLSGSNELRPASIVPLWKVIGILKSSHFKLRIEGHTDNAPLKSGHYRSNWELSTERALSVLRWLQGQGIAPDRMSVAGYGEYRPLQPNTTAAGRARNRRVEIVILRDKPSFWAGMKNETDAVPRDQTWTPLVEEKLPRPLRTEASHGH